MTLAAIRPRPPALAGEIRLSTLANGLRLCRVANPQAPVVASALFYGVGARDEDEGHGGLAHFLEHLMFKGSERYGAGEIDRRTQALGGVNNAFTSHDVTAYWFTFAAQKGSDERSSLDHRVLEIEAKVKSKQYLEAVDLIETVFKMEKVPVHHRANLYRLVGDCFAKLGDLDASKDAYQPIEIGAVMNRNQSL